MRVEWRPAFFVPSELCEILLIRTWRQRFDFELLPAACRNLSRRKRRLGGPSQTSEFANEIIKFHFVAGAVGSKTSFLEHEKPRRFRYDIKLVFVTFAT